MITESTIKKHLQQAAKERNTTPAEVWQHVILERFLVRLCSSPYGGNFILKGGILLARRLDIGRETKDLDFAVHGFEKNIEKLQQAFEEIASIKLDDGFEFKNIKVERLSQFHNQYPGAQIRIDACFGKSRMTQFIDLGFGDHVEVRREEFPLTATAEGPLFETTVKLSCYPMEFVFAEKLETVLFRSAENSRMKDFHDLYTMVIKHGALDRDAAMQALQLVCKHRGTPLRIPIAFSEQDLKGLQSQWQRYLPSLARSITLPKQIEEVVTTINAWLGPRPD